jgi:hypothetical protein
MTTHANLNEAHELTLDKMRDDFSALHDARATIIALSRWFGSLTDELGAEISPEQLSVERLTSETNNPVAWCLAEGFAIDPSIEADLISARVAGGGGEVRLAQVTLYALGRAAMRSVLDRPAGSAGLTRAFGWFGTLAGAYICYQGARDEFLEEPTLMPDVREEVLMEAKRFGTDPTIAAEGIDRVRSAQTISAAGEAKSLEAAVHWRNTDVLIHFTFGEVISLVSERDPELAANLLEFIGNPTLLSLALARQSEVDSLLKLFRHTRLAFDHSGSWTGGFVARIVVHSIEERLIERIRRRLHSDIFANIPSLPELADSVREIDDIAAAFHEREDGPRLAVEWIAHLVASMLNALATSFGDSGSRILRALPYQTLLEIVSIRFGSESWADPQVVWNMFKGGDHSLMDQAVPAKVPNIPEWYDLNSARDHLIPAAVAIVLMRRNGHSASEKAGKLYVWIRLALKDLEQEPRLAAVLARNHGGLARILGWPCSLISNPAEGFRALWHDAVWARTRARFTPLEKAFDIIRCCAAHAHIGIQLLDVVGTGEHTNDPDNTTVCLTLLRVVADVLDELRYGVPEVGLDRWSTLVGTLAAVATRIGLLRDEPARQALLGRYLGDDDALAAAAVNMMANGVTAKDVSRAIRSLQADPADLFVRWLRWNERFAYDRNGKLNDFASKLSALS